MGDDRYGNRAAYAGSGKPRVVLAVGRVLPVECNGSGQHAAGQVFARWQVCQAPRSQPGGIGCGVHRPTRGTLQGCRGQMVLPVVGAIPFLQSAGLRQHLFCSLEWVLGSRQHLTGGVQELQGGVGLAQGAGALHHFALEATGQATKRFIGQIELAALGFQYGFGCLPCLPFTVEAPFPKRLVFTSHAEGAAK